MTHDCFWRCYPPLIIGPVQVAVLPDSLLEGKATGSDLPRRTYL